MVLTADYICYRGYYFSPLGFGRFFRWVGSNTSRIGVSKDRRSHCQQNNDLRVRYKEFPIISKKIQAVPYLPENLTKIDLSDRKKSNRNRPSATGC